MKERYIGVDTGGTFTDLVALTPGGLVHHKLSSTPDGPSRAVLDGIADAIGEGSLRPGDRIAHGTTVATNAILTGDVARAVLVTTLGFEDVLEIGRQDRPALYDLEVKRPEPLIPRDRRLGIAERIGPEGQVERELTPGSEEITELIDRISSLDPPPEAIAISFLHSYANAAHELIVTDALERRFPGIPITCSSGLIPLFREYERSSTVAVNASVQPIMGRYLGALRDGIGEADLVITTSSGGCLSCERAAREPVHTLLSGPAAGVAGALAVARRAGFEKILTFDMGGTSTDVALCDGAIRQTSEGGLEGYPLLIEQIDMHTVGAGGGSLARIDRGGALNVGPQSAGADPGPLAYGRRDPGPDGEGVTVTDANLLLGRLPVGGLLGGSMELDSDAALSGLRALASAAARAPGAHRITPEEAAEGVVRVAITAMAAALRKISVERGKDPREYILVAFGGAGAMHAAALAAEIGVERVLIPREPGLLSAVGTLVAGLRVDRARTVLGSDAVENASALDQIWNRLEEEALEGLEEAGVSREECTLLRRVDLRYRGQAFELTVDAPGQEGRGPAEPWEEMKTRFGAAHLERYGFSRPGIAVELVSLRVEGRGPEAADLDTLLPRINDEGSNAPDISNGEFSAGEFPTRAMIWDGMSLDVPQIPRERLTPGLALQGPLLIHEFSATTIVPPGAGIEVGSYGDLLLTLHG